MTTAADKEREMRNALAEELAEFGLDTLAAQVRNEPYETRLPLMMRAALAAMRRVTAADSIQKENER